MKPWLVDADKPSTVRLRYRLPTALNRSRNDMPDSPATRVVEVSTKVIYPAA